MSSLTVEAAEDQKWIPTHVQVTVLRGRGLRGKGKHNTSDVYTIIQLGKEKYSTCVVEKTTEPEWREECSFELLQPDVNNDLVLTVMHRAVMGLDVFLGQAVVHLEKIFNETRYVKNEWYKLNSKTGKKEKERGDIQVTIQFTRNNLTASMYDLVMKDKSASTFGKLKERIRGKKRASEEDSQSAVLPGGYGNLYKMRQRLPSDGGGEEEYEDDEGGEARRSKMRTYFLRGKLRKSSDTRSSTSLGSESSESSSRGGSLSPTAAISLVVSDLSNSPSNSSNLTADNSPEHTGNTSPKSCSLICEFGDDDDEAGEITILVPQPTVCVNGSHTYDFPRQPLDPGSGNPVDSLGLGLGLQKSLPMSVSLQNLNPRTTDDLPLPKGVVVGDGRRWSFDKPDEEEKAAIAAALEQSGPMVADDEDESLGFDAVSPKAASSSSSMTESEGHGKKPKRNFFSHGGKGQKDETEQGEEKHRGWFGSKETHSKPSLVVSPKVQSPTNPHPPPLPRSQHPPGPPVDPGSPLHHSNPFCRSQTTSPPMSPCNPFFSLIQQNPFYEDILTPQPSNPSSLPPLPYLSTARPPIATLFPQSNNPNPYPNLTYNSPASEDSIIGTDTKQELKAKLERRPLPPIPTKEEERLNNNLFKDFKSAGRLEPESEWDEGFEAFAAGRLQSPEELTTDCNTQQNTPSDNPLEHCNIKGSSQHITDAVQNTNVNDALQHQPCTELIFQAHKTIVQATNTNTHHFDAFAQFLETIPEHTSFESDPITSNSPANSPKLDACTETNEANSTSTNTTDLTDTNLHQDPHQASSVKPNNVSPDHTSSGIGSSAEEDLISCLSSSYSDKFSASSSEETEAQNFESNILYFEKSVESALDKHLQALHSKDDITDRSNDLSLVAQDTFIGHRDGDEKADINGSVAPQSPVLTNQEPAIAAIETGSEDAVSQALSELQPNSNGSPQHDNEKEEEKGIFEFSGSPEDLSKVLDESFVSLSSTTDAISTNNELCSADPSINIITSSTGLRQNTSKNTLEGQDSIQSSPIPFGLIGDFLNTSSITNIPSEGFDDPLLNTPVSNQSTSSFLTSLYVTTSSQDYQSCGSDQSSNFSWPNKMLQSANSTLCGEPSDLQSTIEDVLDQDDSTNAPKPSTEEINQTEQSEESILEAKDKTSTLEPRFTLGDDFDSEFFTAESTDSYTSCDPSKIAEGVAESPHVNLDDVLSNCPQAESATLHRSQSEGTLIPTFDELLLPSFGSDPGAIQESNYLSKPGPDLNLTSLTSFAPFLTPGSSSSPVVLCTFPSLATAIVRSPPETTSTPKPQETPQQAASQQNSPHPVKPLSTAPLAEERRTEGRSVLATGLEKLKSTIHPGRSSHVSEQETERKKSLTEGAGSYYHLNHSELVALLVQRESDLERQKTEFERQRFLLAKREVELRRLKPQVRDLEDYIDTLLVRIMEQKPTLLQVRSKLK